MAGDLIQKGVSGQGSPQSNMLVTNTAIKNFSKETVRKKEAMGKPDIHERLYDERANVQKRLAFSK